MKQKIILASTSPRRHELAKTMGLDFDIVPSRYEEDMTLKLSPHRLVMELAFGKAEDVAKRHKDAIVIGVDTIVVFKGKKLGKPVDKKHAFDMLKSFSGKAQRVYSGVAIIDCRTGRSVRSCEETKLWFRKMHDDEIWRYVQTGEPLDKAGAYGIQDLSSIFVKKIDGCYYNVVGFPIHNIYICLKKLGVNIFEHERWNRKN
jgi:septum formation protein